MGRQSPDMTVGSTPTRKHGGRLPRNRDLLTMLAPEHAMTLSAPSASSIAPTWIWLVLCTASAVATATDLRSMRIPNWLTLPLLLAGITYAGLTGGWEGVRAALGGAAITGSIFVLGYAMAGGGAGDAKLMLAIGSWLNFRQGLVVMFFVAVCGLVWAIIVVTKRSSLREMPGYFLGSLGLNLFQLRSLMRGRAFHIGDGRADTSQPPKERPKHWYPYAPAIFVGTAVAWFWLTHFGFLR